LDLDQKSEQTVQMAPARPHAFVSKRSGKYDLYKIDLDGKNEKLLLPGTGRERDDLALLQHPAASVAALASSRDTARNAEGFLLSTLSLVNLQDGSTVSVGKSEEYRLLGWAGDKLVFVQVAAGASASNPRRQRLMTYDYKTKETHELASTNYFNDVLLIGSSVYYAPSVTLNNGGVGLFKIGTDGGSKQTLLDQEVWNIFRTSYDTLVITQQQKWYSYKLGEQKGVLLNSVPNQVSRQYADNSDKTASLWQEDRDGKGTLLLYKPKGATDKVIRSQSGLTYPLEWANNSTVIYRIVSPNETADYVLNMEGGQPRKIKDVTNVKAITLWGY